MERWTVTWHSAPPVDEFGDQPPDDAVPHTREFSTDAEARAYATVVAPQAWFGVATIRHWITVTKRELDAALASDRCGHYDLDRRRGVIWLADEDVEEVAP